MIVRLTVKNLAVVEAADVAFGAGLNVITGETGAGKSVLMGALHLLLGERADRTLIRTGASEASVCGVYAVEDTGAIDAILEEAEVPPCEGGELILRRTLTTAGQSRVRINDAPATTTLLRRLAPMLTEVHGPDDPHTLLDEGAQLAMVDAFANDAAERAAYGEAWRQLKALEAERHALTGDPGERETEIEQLTYDIDEITAVAPTPEDGESLMERHAQAANAEEILALGNGVADRLTDGEDTIAERLLVINRTLHDLARLLPEASEWQQELSGIQEQLQALSRTIAIRLSQIDADPEALEQLERRMGQIQRLRRRYGPTIEAVLEHLESAQKRLARLQDAEGLLAALETKLSAAHQQVEARAQILSQKRNAALAPLSRAIKGELRALGFRTAEVPIRCTPCAPSASGGDTVTFYFAPNPGEAPRPLAAIASSGEIARVMLAIDAILAQHTAVPTLVFDEIDANIGGETGRAVGQKLRALGNQTQLLCITHQPQCAIYGHQHFCVRKHLVDGRSVTQISPLAEEERPAEIARMLGGADLTSVTVEHAREMLAHAASDK